MGTQDLNAEVQYQARQAGGLGRVQPTPRRTLERYRDHRHWRLYSKEWLFHQMARFQPRTVCDFGCGAGETVTEMAWIGYQVTGRDVSPDLIDLARERARLDGVEDRATFELVDASDPEQARGSFDLLIAQGVLHHIDLASGLKAIDRLLRPGGIALIHEPVAFSPGLQRLRDRVPVEKDISPNERQVNPDDIRLIGEHFEILEQRHFNLFLRGRRLARPLGRFAERLYVALAVRLDALLLGLCPFLRRYAGTLVLAARKKSDC